MEEFVRNFGIDGKLLLAQAANFIILLFLLKRYAYGPLLKMMKDRKAEIEKGIRFKEESERKLAEIEVLREKALTTARQEAFTIVKKGEENAEGRKREILDETGKKAETIIEEARRRIREEESKMKDGVIQSAEELVRRALASVLGRMHPSERDAPLIQEALGEARRAMKKS
jgi:F-type H+-transporting ATPase subunit b